MNNRPIKVKLDRLPDAILQAINEVLCDKYGKCPDGYSVDVIVDNIDWGEEE